MRPSSLEAPPKWPREPGVPLAHQHQQADIIGGGLPAGVIVMWSGLIANIPAGWLVCDGTNGTPDLRNRFIKGASGEPGGTGGSATHSHTTGTYAVSAHTGAGVDAHSGVTVGNHSALATHAHELPFQKVAGGTGVLRMLAASIFGTGTSRSAESQSAAPAANTTSAAVELSQAVSAGTPSVHVVTQPNNHVMTQANTHTLSGTSDTVNHEPAYYVLAFIMKA